MDNIQKIEEKEYSKPNVKWPTVDQGLEEHAAAFEKLAIDTSLEPETT